MPSRISPSRPVSVEPSDSVISTLRPRARRKCFSVVSGRSTPGEVTSRTYGAPAVVEASSSSDATRDSCGDRVEIQAVVAVGDHCDPGRPRRGVDHHVLDFVSGARELPVEQFDHLLAATVIP